MPKETKHDFSYPPVIVLDLPDTKNACLYRGIFEEANKNDYGILDLHCTNQTIPDGINIAGYITRKQANDPWVINLLDKGFPVIRLGRIFQPKPGFHTLPTVVPSLYSAGKIAADYFADRLFKNLAFVGNYPWRMYPHAYNGFYEQAKNRGCKCHLLQIKDPKLKKSVKLNRDEDFNYRMNQLIKWLEPLPKPLGILTYNDRNTSRIYTFASINGFKVPTDIALLGIGNEVEICDFVPVPLSSIDMNLEKQGRALVRLIQQAIDGEPESENPVIINPKGVVERQSTNLLAVPDPVVAMAVSFIWEHYQKQLSIDDVAKVAGVSRTTIIRKFKQHLNHGVNTEIRRKRLEKSKNLLRGTTMIVADVASESGFPTVTYFHKAFVKAYGMTPGEFREIKD